MKQFWKRPPGRAPGTGILSSRHFPDDFQGNFLDLNVSASRASSAYKVSEDGSGLKGETLEDSSPPTDPNFRPSRRQGRPGRRASISPTGRTRSSATCSTTSATRTATTTHGRIYRMTYEGRPLLKPPKIDGQPIEALLELLKEPEDRRPRAAPRSNWASATPSEVIAAVKKWIAALDKSDPDYEHHRAGRPSGSTSGTTSVDADLLKRMLASPEPRARAAAVRVLCYWRDRVPDALALLKEAGRR